MLLREVTEGQHVLSCLSHKLSGSGEALGQRGRQVVPAGQDFGGVLLGEHRAQGGRDHALVGFWHPLQQVPGEMDPAALPAAALELASDRLGEAHVGIAHHELDASQAALYCFAEDLLRKAPVLSKLGERPQLLQSISAMQSSEALKKPIEGLPTDRTPCAAMDLGRSLLLQSISAVRSSDALPRSPLTKAIQILHVLHSDRVCKPVRLSPHWS